MPQRNHSVIATTSITILFKKEQNKKPSLPKKASLYKNLIIS